MSRDAIFYEVVPFSLKKQAEEVCGDHVQIARTPDTTTMVLSDGLGSGIKAAILARLTTEIIVTMLSSSAPLRDVIETVSGTLPICRVHGVAYATFAILQIQHTNGRFQLASFDSPPPILLKNGQPQRLATRSETISGKSIQLSAGVLEYGDFLALMSDGVLYASAGFAMDPKWGWDEIAAFLSNAAHHGCISAEDLVHAVMHETQRRYGDGAGDDATFVGVLARKPRTLIVFTGPPVDKNRDAACAERLLRFQGRRVVCGGTTANIVAEYCGNVPHTRPATAREGIPPTADLPDIDLLTEGILTFARTLDLLKESGGDPRRLPHDRNAAVLLATEFLRADSVLLLAGDSVNPYYQNPQLPRSISIRRSLVNQVAEVLTRFQKDVSIEWV